MNKTLFKLMLKDILKGLSIVGIWTAKILAIIGTIILALYMSRILGVLTMTWYTKSLNYNSIGFSNFIFMLAGILEILTIILIIKHSINPIKNWYHGLVTRAAEIERNRCTPPDRFEF